MSYREVLEAHRRLAILRLLDQAPGRTANSMILRDALDQAGHWVGHDVVLADLAWLAEQGLVELERMAELAVARLSTRGADVAAGRSAVPGVARA